MFLCPECLAELGASAVFSDAVSKLVHRATKHYPGYIAFAGIMSTVLSAALWSTLTRKR